jgi:hypothetical protein
MSVAVLTVALSTSLDRAEEVGETPPIMMARGKAKRKEVSGVGFIELSRNDHLQRREPSCGRHRFTSQYSGL